MNIIASLKNHLNFAVMPKTARNSGRIDLSGKLLKLVKLSEPASDDAGQHKRPKFGLL